jgi:tetratricopeptide (TPR) repeat protein
MRASWRERTTCSDCSRAHGRTERRRDITSREAWRAAELSDPDIRAAALYSNLADYLHAAGRRAEALEHVERSVEILAEINVVSGQMQPEVWKLVEW